MTWKRINSKDPLNNPHGFEVDAPCECCGRTMEISGAPYKDLYSSDVIPNRTHNLICAVAWCNFCEATPNHQHTKWMHLSFDKDTSKWINIFRHIDKIEWKNLLGQLDNDPS